MNRTAVFMFATLVLALASTFAFAPDPAPPPAEPAPTPPAEGEPSSAPPSAALPSRITEVVVFPQHAEVTRELTVLAAAGPNRVVFAGLVPSLNPHTLRASAADGARITGTEIRTVYLEESLTEEIAAVDRRIRELEDAIAAEAQANGRCNERAAFYQSVKQRLAGDMGQDLGEGRVSVADWEQVLAFVTDGLRGCDEEARAIAGRVRDLKKDLEARRSERQDFAGRQPSEMKLAEVAFVAARDGAQTIRIHYMVDAATWKPSYDVHLDRAAGEIEIVAYGQVVQWSGEPWNDVALTLAMSRPDLELALPDLTPMVASLDDALLTQLAKEAQMLSAAPQGQALKWSEARFKRRQDRETFRRNLEQLSRLSVQNLQRYGLSREIIQGAMTRLADRFSTVRYAIAEPATIPLDSSPHKVVSFSARVPAQLRYVATPALGNAVVLRGETVNTSGAPILEGGASLFSDGSYIGASVVPSAARNENLSFGFGPDDGLIVDRRLLSRTVKGPEAFRQSQVITYHYEITVENFNGHAVAVEVSDQIPISKSDDIEVEFLEATGEPAVSAQTGVLRWSLGVEPSARRTIAYSFSVECPVGRQVHWK